MVKLRSELGCQPLPATPPSAQLWEPDNAVIGFSIHLSALAGAGLGAGGLMENTVPLSDSQPRGGDKGTEKPPKYI